MSKLRLGIVGCGDIAGFTAWVSKLIPRVQLAACCDVCAERAQAFAKRHGIRSVFTDYAQLLASAPLDAVYLAVPHHLHYEMILAAVEASKAVLVEKPLTRTLEEGIKLAKALDQSGVKVGVNYQYRYDSGCYAMARAVQQGALGKVMSVRINVPWHREPAYFEGTAWHKTIAQAGGGALITQGSHFLDVVLWALKEMPVSAMGYTATPGFDVQIETLVHGIVETSGGTLIGITSTMAATCDQAVTIEMYGEKGTAVYTDRPLPRVRFIGAKIHKERPPEWGVHALQRSLVGFARWALNDKPFLTPAASTLPVQAAVDAMYRSAQSGRRESVEI
jgi:UDP-N-acetyl-2-amino-2-deoxyglucuronate dehydrogenase